MEVLKIIVTILFIIICIALTVAVMLQEGKQQGLGAIAGMGDSYWSKNKGRSMDGIIVKITTVLVALFLIIAAVLCIGSF